MSARRRRKGWILVGLVAAALATAGYVYSTARGPSTQFRTARVDRGPIVATVSATGALAAVTTVQVGSQVSGQVRDVLVDFNTPVRRNQLIARIDPETFQAKVNAARADLENTQAQVLNQRANVEKARSDVENARAAAATAAANVEKVRADVENARAMIASAQANVARETATTNNARIELERRMDLFRRQLVSQSDRDQAQTAFDTAQAQLEATRAQLRAGEAALRSAEAQLVAVQSQARAATAQVGSAQAALGVAEAQLKAAEATVRQRQAALEQAQLDLAHTEIRAPVDGVVVSRNVDPGQTVAASLQAPTLFTIAQDLTRMQVEAAVDEADVGRLREGLDATFTVDAFPGRTFRGEISQIRKAAQVVQNVVTYTTVITVPNPDRILLPGMTANVRIPVDRRADVLRLPNAALRYRPPDDSGARGGARPGAPPGAAAPAPAPGATPGATRPVAPEGGAAGAGGAPRAGEAGLGELRTRLVRELALTPDQQVKLDAILAASRQAMAGLRGQRPDDPAVQAQRRRIRDDVREKIRGILTPEQQRGFEAIVTAPPPAGAPRATAARVYVPGADGRPRAVSVQLGLTDGTYSEVISGDLQAGQEVIVGAATAAGQRSSGGPRLRF